MPIITLLGDSYSTRIVSSTLRAQNIDVLITSSESEYEALANELATNKEKLNHFLEKIKINNLSFDPYQFTRELENLYNSIKEV